MYDSSIEKKNSLKNLKILEKKSVDILYGAFTMILGNDGKFKYNFQKR